jgi:VWFA-related protein
MSKASCALLLFLFGSSVLSSAQQGAPQATLPPQATAPAVTQATPASTQRPIFLDVLVTDHSGKPVADLEPFDFSVMDNNQPRKILGFRRTDGAVGSKMDPPVEVIIILDAVNLPYQAATQLRLDVEKFLRQNGGHLAQPVSVFIFASEGLHLQPAPSKDGNAVAAMLDRSTGTVRSRGTAGDVYGLAEQFQTSVKTLAGIADNEARKPGRKMLIWIGPGWPMLADPRFIETNESRENYFRSVVSLSKKLREARVTIYSLYSIVGITSRGQWESFLKPLKDPRKAETGNLALQVLVTQTGGRVLDPSTDVAGEISSCVADIGPYYTLAFEPPIAVQANEYHELKVLVDKPQLSVRTNTGYYNQPPEK